MEYIYAALLLYKAGKDIKEELIISVLTAAGVNINETRVKALVAALEGVNIEEAISKTAFASAQTEPITQKCNEETKEETNNIVEEKEPDHSEEDGMAGLGALFG